jgi:Flp pilus assembly protein TadD
VSESVEFANDLASGAPAHQSIVCGSCGARIKADRPRCLRCDAPLQAVRSPHLKLPAWLESRGGGTLIFATVGTLVLCFGVVAFWGPGRTDDDVARPAPGATRLGAPKPRKAAEDSTPAVRPDPYAAPVTAFDSTARARAQFGSGDFEGAQERLNKALEKNPNDAEALNGLGLTLERMGQVDDAIERFSRAIEIAPDKWTYHFNLAHAFGLQGKWDRAVGEYRRASALFPSDYAIQFNLANALHKQGDDVSAIPAYERAIQLAPGEATFHLSLAVSFESVNRLDDARREFRRYLEMEPSGPEAGKVKAHLEALSGASARPSEPPASAPSS